MSEFGIIGLGRMGSALACRAMDAGISAAGTSRSGVPADLREAGLRAAEDAAGLVAALDQPRLILLSLPAGLVVDNAIEELRPHLETGDVILDGGNSYWGDSIGRSEDLAGKGIRFLDLGVSGGPDGARHAPCFMVGGPEDGVTVAEPVLLRLAGERGDFVHAGGPGAGHFVKLVHNGIEFGMLQAIGEGMAMLEAHSGPLDIAGTLQAWRGGSVIRSYLVDLMAEAYAKDPDLECPSGLVEDTGEVN